MEPGEKRLGAGPLSAELGITHAGTHVGEGRTRGVTGHTAPPALSAVPLFWVFAAAFSERNKTRVLRIHRMGGLGQIPGAAWLPSGSIRAVTSGCRLYNSRVLAAQTVV